MQLAIPDAKMEIAVLNAQTAEFSKAGIRRQLESRGLTEDGVSAVDKLWEHTQIITGQTFNIGKIIVVEILNFSRANPNWPIDVLLDAAATALGSMAPCLHSILVPIQSTSSGNNEEIMTIAKHFFSLPAAIFNVLEDELVVG
jgi:hypothetical protein